MLTGKELGNFGFSRETHIRFYIHRGMTIESLEFQLSIPSFPPAVTTYEESPMKNLNFANIDAAKTPGALMSLLSRLDPTTVAHAAKTRELAAELGTRCGLQCDELRALRVASYFHDVGKISIKADLLRKNGVYDSADLALMSSHPVVGSRVIAESDFEDASRTANAVLHHHENFDGSGYPDGLAGEDIPILSRIISIVDRYDAIAGPGSYHEMPLRDHLLREFLNGSEEQNDPDLMRLFRTVVAKMPRH